MFLQFDMRVSGSQLFSCNHYLSLGSESFRTLNLWASNLWGPSAHRSRICGYCGHEQVVMMPVISTRGWLEARIAYSSTGLCPSSCALTRHMGTLQDSWSPGRMLSRNNVLPIIHMPVSVHSRAPLCSKLLYTFNYLTSCQETALRRM